jgi:hypothetical protein
VDVTSLEDERLREFLLSHLQNTLSLSHKDLLTEIGRNEVRRGEGEGIYRKRNQIR